MTPPENLFKYTTGDTARIVLRTSRLRWSSPEKFNDPAEFQRLPKFEPSLIEAISDLPKILVSAAAGESVIDVDRLSAQSKYLYDLFKFGISNGMKPEDFLDTEWREERPLDQIYHERLREFFGDNFIRQARVLCLSANPPNPAMWVNYAETHAGCLLGFKHLPEWDTPLQEAKQVTYHHEPPCIGSGLDFLLYGASKELRKLTIDSICFAKRIEWQYEQEWRVITWRSNEGDALHGDYPFLSEELESVTFGLKSKEDLISELTSIILDKYPLCTLYRMQSIHGELQRVEVP